MGGNFELDWQYSLHFSWPNYEGLKEAHRNLKKIGKTVWNYWSLTDQLKVMHWYIQMHRCLSESADAGKSRIIGSLLDICKILDHKCEQSKIPLKSPPIQLVEYCLLCPTIPQFHIFGQVRNSLLVSTSLAFSGFQTFQDFYKLGWVSVQAFGLFNS